MINSFALPLIYFIPIFVFVFILLFQSTFLLVHEAEAVIIERFGKFDRILQPGLHLVIPFVEQPRKILWTTVTSYHNEYIRKTSQEIKIDVRECVYDFPKQNVITKDNVTMEITAILYYQIINPHAAVYEVYNLSEAIEKLAQTTLRNIIGSMDLDETLVSRDDINERLRTVLFEAATKWGVQVNRVELQEVNPPIDIRHAMEKQMRAERERREMILRAEGAKTSAILEAQGQQEAHILKARGQATAEVAEAEGKASARLTLAEAEAKAIEKIKHALPSQNTAEFLIAQNYIEALSKMTTGKDNKTIIIPYEAQSLVNSISMIKHVFEKDSSANTPENR